MLCILREPDPDDSEDNSDYHKSESEDESRSLSEEDSDSTDSSPQSYIATPPKKTGQRNIFCQEEDQVQVQVQV